MVWLALSMSCGAEPMPGTTGHGTCAEPANAPRRARRARPGSQSTIVARIRHNKISFYLKLVAISVPKIEEICYSRSQGPPAI